MFGQDRAATAKTIGMLIFDQVQNGVANDLALQALQRLPLAPGIQFVVIVGNQKHIVAGARGRLSQELLEIGLIHGRQTIKARGYLLDVNQGWNVSGAVSTYAH
jgi:hypothetical protein